MLPEVVDESKGLEGKHKYVDPEGQYIFVYEGNVSGGANPGYNPKLLGLNEFKSFSQSEVEGEDRFDRYPESQGGRARPGKYL